MKKERLAQRLGKVSKTVLETGKSNFNSADQVLLIMMIITIKLA